eukprot:1473522-Amphidinium_carterae.1
MGVEKWGPNGCSMDWNFLFTVGCWSKVHAQQVVLSARVCWSHVQDRIPSAPRKRPIEHGDARQHGSVLSCESRWQLHVGCFTEYGHN